jgi:hypothetical protein
MKSMRADDEGEVAAVAQAIRDYLAGHALAADAVGGVARWWLGPAHAHVTLEQVERALDLLVARNEMRRLRLMDGTFLFSQAPPTRQ